MRHIGGILDKHERAVAAALLALGFALRLVCLASLPCGLNQDEASAGYDAWALLNYGVDRCGNAWPVLLEAWGSGQNALMSWLAMPFIAALGLTETAVRLPNALAGCFTLAVFWRLARRTRGGRFGLLALALLAINPWHIMASRWALESNLLPAALMAGLWCCALAEERPWAAVGAGAAFGLALYAYGTAFFFLPPFLIIAAVRLRRYLSPAPAAAALGVFALLALPITLCQAANALGLGEIHLLGLTLPELTSTRQSATSVLGGGGWAAAWDNFRTFLGILWRQSDGLPWNSLGLARGGIFYVFGLPAAAVGLAVSFGGRKNTPQEWPLRAGVLCALACTFLISGNINRLNMLWPLLVYFEAVGCYVLLRALRSWAALPLAGIALCFALFLGGYNAALGEPGNVNFFPGLGEAIEYAESERRGGEDIYITDYVNAPYIFALFYTQTDPLTFSETVDYADESAAFRSVLGFEGFRFGDAAEAEGLAVLHVSELDGREALAVFGSYAVCRGNETEEP